MPQSQMQGAFAPAPALNACTRCGDIYQGSHDCAMPAEAPISLDVARLNAAGFLGTREEIQDELDDIASAIRGFHVKPPDQVMRECSAYSARLTELCMLLHRVESLDRQYVRVRTQQVERFLTEVDRQYKIASRLVEIQRQDIYLSGGQV